MISKKDPFVYISVVSNAPWTYWESANLRGSPATHAIVPSGERTLCGRKAFEWSMNNPEFVNCKICLRILGRITNDS